MIITLCVKCRCTTSLTTEPVLSTKTITKDSTRFMAIVCAACGDYDNIDDYNEVITSDDIMSMQEWKYVIDYASSQGRVFNVNTVGDHVVVFKHNDVVQRTAKVVKSQAITTCRTHSFQVHHPPKLAGATLRVSSDLLADDE